MAVDGRDEMRPEDARIAALYRHATGEMPPERLDSAIRKHARAPKDGVKPQKHTLWRPAWRLPFVAAALAVVCASVVTLVMERDGGRLTVPPETPAPDGGETPPFSVQREPPPLSQSMPDRATVEPRSGSAEDAPPLTRERAEPPREAEVRKSIPESKARIGERSAAPPDGRVLGAEPSHRSDAPASRGNKTSGGNAPLAYSQPPAPATSTFPDRVTAPPAPRAEDDSLSKALPAPSAEASPAAKPAPAANPRPAPQPESAPAPEAKPATEAKALARKRLESTPGEPRVPARVSALIAELENEPPARWVERMLALRREDRRQDAEALLAEFKRRFPGERLPASLQQNDE